MVTTRKRGASINEEFQSLPERKIRRKPKKSSKKDDTPRKNKTQQKQNDSNPLDKENDQKQPTPMKPIQEEVHQESPPITQENVANDESEQQTELSTEQNQEPSTAVAKEDVPEQQTDLSTEAVVEQDQIEATSTPTKPKVAATTSFKFNKQKALESLEQQQEELEDCEPKEDNVNLNANLNHQRKLYLQLKELRTTEVEQLLEDVRLTAATKEKSHKELISALTAEVVELKKEKELLHQKTEDIQWKKEYIELKHLYKKLQKDKETSSNQKGTEMLEQQVQDLTDINRFYQEFTGLSVQLEENTAVCIAKNKRRRKLVKFSIEFCKTEDGQSGFRFTPLANKALLAEKLQQPASCVHHQAQNLLSNIWRSLDKE